MRGHPVSVCAARPHRQRSMAMTCVVTVDANPPSVAVHPTLGRIKMDEDAETAHWKGEPTDAGEKG